MQKDLFAIFKVSAIVRADIIYFIECYVNFIECLSIQSLSNVCQSFFQSQCNCEG